MEHIQTCTGMTSCAKKSEHLMTNNHVSFKLREVLCVKLLKWLCIYKAEKNEKVKWGAVTVLLRKLLDFPTHEWQIKDWLRSRKNEGKGERKRAVYEAVTCDFLFLEAAGSYVIQQARVSYDGLE